MSPLHDQPGPAVSEHPGPVSLDPLAIMHVVDLVAAQHAARGAKPERLRTIRAALYAAIDAPAHSTWDRVFQLPVWSDGGASAPVSLWQLTVQHAGFQAAEHRLGARWPVVPSGMMIVVALCEHFGPRATC
ncbi:hypothetical protein ACXR2T_09990 [Leucobacter sp. HY1910]